MNITCTVAGTLSVMAMVKALVKKEGAIDFSFMPSLQCDLSCAHCMYNSSPLNKAELDFERTARFAETVGWRLINSCGFYGGEPGINIPMYERFMGLVPGGIQKFTITDGTWSRTPGRTRKFMDFAKNNDLQVFISSTEHHTPYQDRDRLELVCRDDSRFVIKDSDEDRIPMGRLATEKWSCSFRCEWDKRPKRFALKPDGTIIFQTCDGVYPMVGTYNNTFETLMKDYAGHVARCVKMRRNA